MMISTPKETRTKFRELILLFTQLSENDTAFGATKLNKLLFFADVHAYRRNGTSITGEEYQKLPYGPAPRRMTGTLANMMEAGEIAERPAQFHGHSQRKFFALRAYDAECFTPTELQIAVHVLLQCERMHGTDMSDLSHDCLGWQLAKDGETIPFEVMLIGDRGVTRAEQEKGVQLEGAALECLARKAA